MLEKDIFSRERKEILIITRPSAISHFNEHSITIKLLKFNNTILQNSVSVYLGLVFKRTLYFLPTFILIFVHRVNKWGQVCQSYSPSKSRSSFPHTARKTYLHLAYSHKIIQLITSALQQ